MIIQFLLGAYDATLNEAFGNNYDILSGKFRVAYEFLDDFNTTLTNQGLPNTNVYTDTSAEEKNPSNWDYHDKSKDPEIPPTLTA